MKNKVIKIKVQKIPIEVSVYSSEVEKYGIEGIKTLLENIIERYFDEEYFDPDLVKEILEEKEERFCVKCGRTSCLLEDEDICYTCARERGRI